MWRRALLASFAIAALVFAGLGALTLVPGTPSAGDEAHPAAAVLSARRAPELLAGAATDASTRAAVSRIIAEGGLPATTRSCVAVRQQGRPVLMVRPQTSLVPASALKIITATAAIDALEPDTRFTTAVRGKAPNRDGVVDGPLYLVGGGDPLLFTAGYVRALDRKQDIHTPLEALADAVVAEDVSAVRGGIVGDHSKFDDERAIPTWDPGYRRQGQVGAVDALIVNQGFTSFGGERVIAADPAAHAADVFAGLLRERGVEVAAPSRSGSVERGTDTIAEIESPPISDVVAEMLTQSDNTTAEMLLKALGAHDGDDGTTERGVAAVMDALGRRGVPTNGLVMVDGSGLDRGDRATCAAVDGALASGGPAGPVGAGLAQAGETGTLRDRMTGTVAEGRVRAKTGTLASVSALAGWAEPSGAPPVSFVLMTNGAPTDAARAVEDRLAIFLATLPPPPPSSVYAPGGAAP